MKNRRTLIVSPIPYIPEGGDEAVSMKALALLTNSTPRDVRLEVLNARLSGELICSNEHGYFRPKTRDEAIHWYRTMKARVHTTMRIIDLFDYIEEEDNK